MIHQQQQQQQGRGKVQDKQHNRGSTFCCNRGFLLVSFGFTGRMIFFAHNYLPPEQEVSNDDEKHACIRVENKRSVMLFQKCRPAIFETNTFGTKNLDDHDRCREILVGSHKQNDKERPIKKPRDTTRQARSVSFTIPSPSSSSPTTGSATMCKFLMRGCSKCIYHCWFGCHMPTCRYYGFW